MKKLILLVVIFATMVVTTSGEEILSNLILNYGLEVNQFSTGSGFKSGIEASAFVIEGNRRSLQLGLYIDSETQKVTGFSVNHKYVFLKNKIDRAFNIEPYFFYNFIYRVTNMSAPLAGNLEIAKILGYEGSTSYTSMEHHFGIGFKIKLFNSMFLHADAGYGRYLGSIKKPSAPDPMTSLIYGTNGWNIITKIGIGYNF